MQRSRLEHLLSLCLQDMATEAEREEFLSLINSPENKDLASGLVLQAFKEGSAGQPLLDQEQSQLILDSIMLANDIKQANNTPASPGARRVRLQMPVWVRYAAAVIIVIGLGALVRFWPTTMKNERLFTDKGKQLTIPPGREKAVLTLADGRQIILDSAANGLLTKQGSAQIMKLSNGRIAYDPNSSSGEQVMWNTMSTPKGSQYQLTLPDGTKIWLNAASSITFPVAFTGKDRTVSISGEAYLEVAKNKEKPFKVGVDGGSAVEVLGTSFNINSYQNEDAVRTTLVDGVVKVTMGSSSETLKPGQQAMATTRTRQLKIQHADIDHILAWKHGFINLEELDVYAVMRELERWYDIKVEYAPSIHNVVFQGQIVRETSLPDVIDLLHEMGVRCRLEDKVLKVY